LPTKKTKSHDRDSKPASDAITETARRIINARPALHGETLPVQVYSVRARDNRAIKNCISKLEPVDKWIRRCRADEELREKRIYSLLVAVENCLGNAIAVSKLQYRKEWRDMWGEIEKSLSGAALKLQSVPTWCSRSWEDLRGQLERSAKYAATMTSAHPSTSSGGNAQRNDFVRGLSPVVAQLSSKRHQPALVAAITNALIRSKHLTGDQLDADQVRGILRK
jgi:hypothetical protein